MSSEPSSETADPSPPSMPRGGESTTLAGPGGQRDFPCGQCGAKLRFSPGSTTLTCEYCGCVNAITVAAAPIEELDFEATLARLQNDAPADDRIVVRCRSCSAVTPLKPNVTSQACAFCGAPVVATGESRKAIRPRSLLPFAVTSDKARESFHRWLASLWFAPSNLKTYASVQAGAGGRLAGFYIPHWTFDAFVRTEYSGQRGDDYTDTERYTVNVNGRTETRTRTVTRTRWSHASGRVENDFDDVVVAASRSLPPATIDALGDWDLKALVPYSDEFLAGFQSESYSVELREGFTIAQVKMAEAIRSTIRGDIGGDHQRIDSMNPHYSEITFKHVLLPVWIAAYRYGDKTYRFVINGRTGRVTGDRPYSWRKIALLIAGVVIVVGVIIAIVATR